MISWFKNKNTIGWSLGLLPIFYLLLAYISFSRKDYFLEHLENFSFVEAFNLLVVFILILFSYLIIFINRDGLTVSKKYFYYILGLVLLLCFVIPPFMSRDIPGYLLASDIFWGNKGALFEVNLANSSWSHYLGNLWWLNYPTPYGPLFVFSLLPVWLLALKSFWLGIYGFKLISLGLFLFSAYLVKKMSDEKTFWLYVFNPALLINFVLEGHNDLWIIVLLLLFLQRKYLGKILSLLGAVFIKYTAIILWPLTWFASGKFKWSLFFISNLIIVSLLALFFWIFSLSPLELYSNLNFLDAKCFYHCSPIVYLIPTNSIRLGLFVVAYGLISWLFLVRKHSPIKFIFWTLGALFMIKVRWLTPWYLLPLIPLALVTEGKIYRYLALLLTFYGLFHYLFL